jgi:hypothetical protein
LEFSPFLWGNRFCVTDIACRVNVSDRPRIGTFFSAQSISRAQIEVGFEGGVTRLGAGGNLGGVTRGEATV